MASRKDEKQARREERLAKEAAAAAVERRAQPLRRLGAVAAAAAVIVVVLVAVSQSGKGGGSDIDGVKDVQAALAGITQSGDTLGADDAPVSITEYGDLQCPACKAFADATWEPMVRELIAPGKAKFVYKQRPILGPDSDRAALAALAAGEQDKLHEYVKLFYRNQGAENSGYVTDEFLQALADAAGLNQERFDADRGSDRLQTELDESAAEAERLGFTGTPSFVVRGPGGEQTVPGVATIEQLTAAVEQVSR